MLRWRLASAGVILTLLISLARLDYLNLYGAPPGAWLLPFYMLALMLGTHELCAMFTAKGNAPSRWPIFLGVAAVSLAACRSIFEAVFPALKTAVSEPLDWSAAAVTAAIILVIAVEMRKYRAPGGNIERIAAAIFAIAYVGLLGGALAAVRLFRDNQWGMAAMVSTLLIVKFCDVGAYSFGRMFGRTKLSPLLSPGKTVEGAIGGIGLSVVVAWLFFHFIAPRLIGSDFRIPGFLPIAAYGIALAVAGMVGDLAESMLKRDMQRKDSSTWLPGLGGVLDILDSVLTGAPVAYVFWAAGVFG